MYPWEKTVFNPELTDEEMYILIDLLSVAKTYKPLKDFCSSNYEQMDKLETKLISEMGSAF